MFPDTLSPALIGFFSSGYFQPAPSTEYLQTSLIPNSYIYISDNSPVILRVRYLVENVSVTNGSSRGGGFHRFPETS